MKLSGIYKIQSIKKPNKVYIGSAKNINKRWDVHLCELRKNKHKNKKLQNHYNKYGEDDLSFSVLLGCEKEELIKYEQFFIDSLNPFFNICKIAGSLLGTKRTKEQRKLISESHKGYKLTEEQKHKISEAAKGRSHKVSEEAKHKMSVFRTGRRHSEETKNKIKEGLANRKVFDPITQEYRHPIMSEETKRKIGKAARGRKGALGKHWKLTNEQKIMKSEVIKKWWAKRKAS